MSNHYPETFGWTPEEALNQFRTEWWGKCHDIPAVHGTLFLPQAELWEATVDLCLTNGHIFVREEYEYIYQRLLDAANWPMSARILSGSPGIGKSYFLLYALVRRMAECSTTLFTTSKGIVYLFDSEAVYSLKATEFKTLQHSERSSRPRSHRTLPTIVNVILAQSPCTAALVNGPGVMANRKSKSGGQSQGPKQAAGGGASRSPNPQATNKPRSVATAHPQMMGNASSKPPASSGTAAAPRPPQPQATAHRPSNGTKHQNAGNGAPKSQRANGSNFAYTGLHGSLSPSSAEAMSGHRASQDRSVNQGTPKRNGSGLNNGPQKVQGHSPQPNISSKNEAPKPKHSQAFFGGKLIIFIRPYAIQLNGSNRSLFGLQLSAAFTTPSRKRPTFACAQSTWSNHIREQGVPRPIADVVAAKQSGHTQPHAQKAQNHAPTPPKEPTFFSASPAHQQQSGKNTASNTFPKVQVATTHAQHPSRGGQSSVPPAQGSEKPSHKSQQQHKAPPHSRLMQETSSHKDTPPKPSTNKGKPPMESVLSTVSSFFSTGSEAPGNPSHKSQHTQQGRAPPHSRPAQETSNKSKFFGVVIAMFKSVDVNGQFPTKSVLPTPKVSPSNHFAGSNGTGNRSVNFVIPPGSTHNSATVGSGSLHSRAAKKQGPNVAKGSANVPQAAAVEPQTWGQMISSWFLPSAPPVDVQAANKSTSSSMKAKDPGPKPQAPNSTKANDGRSKSHPAPDLSFNPREHLRKEPILSTKGAKNGLQDLPNRSNNSDTSSSATSPKKEQVPTHHNMLARSDGGPQYSSSVSEKPEMAINLTSALSHAADRSRMSSKPQAAAVHHLKQFQIRSSSSKVLSQHDPKKKAAVRKGLLRQRTPTLRWRESDTPRTVSAYSTLTAAPLPSPPRNELQNKVARKTISQNPDLFKVVSPIKVDIFKEYVKDHPNQSFVQSVARALKKGF
ncbi:unnamed protein product [Cyclocybe aegerita]|uniref:Uncharacterized protein n=1 Tax=Cyclocybe aegerita TaxID=1973307 RepID=A0A8S0XXF3_CYCAE|nr:unnamed protein product [Cyclocybe aegerita]